MTAPPTPSPSGESSRRPWDFSPYAKKFREEAGGDMYAMQWIPRLERIIEDRELPIAMRINAAYDRFCNAHLSHCMVDGLPPLKPGDRSPSKIKLAKLAEILHEPVSTVSMANKLLREHLLARPAGEDGALYTEHTVQESLFAVQRENPPASPLDSSTVGGSPNPLLQWKAFEKQWFDANPGEAARVRTLGAEREELRRQQKELSEDIDEIKRRPLKAWKRYLSAAASDSRNGAVHGVETDSSPAPAPPEAPPSGSPEQNVHDSPPPEDAKSSTVNESADPISNREDTPSSSSSGNATEHATTTTLQTPPTAEPAAKTDSATPGVEEAAPPEDLTPQLMTDVEFHRALSVAFRTAGKPVPTPEQSGACYVGVGAPAAPRFLGWLERPYRSGERPLPPKLPGVQHPGVLKALVAEFESWCAAEPPPPPAPPPPKPVCSFCGGSGFPGASCNTLPEARDLIAAGIGPCVCEIGKLWREMLE
jgi:hypothetical protein